MEELEARNLHLLESEQWSDCVFLVGESPDTEAIKAHKVHLASSSRVFATMFYGSLPEGSEPIRVLEIRPVIFKMLLKYIYTTRLTLNDFEEAGDLYYCANKYMIPALATKCMDHIESILSFEQVCNIYEFAEHYEKHELLKDCVDLMRSETQKILTHPSWQNTAKATVSVLFEQDSLAIHSEIELYCALIAWSEAECRRRSFPIDEKSMRSVSGDLVTKIRFLTLTPEQFARGLGRTGILSETEALAIITNILSVKVDMPDGFCVERSSRCNVHDDKQEVLATAPKTLVDVSSAYCRPNGPIHCCWPDERPYFVCRNIFGINDHLNFRVDKKIKVHGVVLPPIPNNGQITRRKSHHFENPVVSVRLRCRQRLATTTSTTKTLSGDEIQIRFGAPVVVEKDKDYQIEINVHSRDFCSVSQTRPVSKDCEGVHFAFPPQRLQSSIMVQGILFSK